MLSGLDSLSSFSDQSDVPDGSSLPLPFRSPSAVNPSLLFACLVRRPLFSRKCQMSFSAGKGGGVGGSARYLVRSVCEGHGSGAGVYVSGRRATVRRVICMGEKRDGECIFRKRLLLRITCENVPVGY